MVRVLLATLLFIFIFSLNGRTQSACELTLNTAQQEFEAGRFSSVPVILKDCLSKNQNREWEQRAYLLLAETYLLLQDNAKAEESYLKIIQSNPEFVTDETRDPIDLVYLSKKFTAAPIFSFSGRFGLNASFVRVINDVKIAPQGNTSEEYSPKIGWQGALGLEYHHTENLSASVEFNVSYFAFSHQTKNLFQAGNYTLDFEEKQLGISFPLLIKYSASKGTLRPYGFGGLGFNFLLQDKVGMILNNNDESPVLNYKDKRTGNTTSLIVGAGLKYKWKLRYLFGEIRYTAGLTNMTNISNRYDQINESWPYVDDDFRLDNVFVGVGYVHPLYKARKLKHAKTKSVLRRIGRSSNEK
jgi:opacity protein-like surface antigen